MGSTTFCRDPQLIFQTTLDRSILLALFWRSEMAIRISSFSSGQIKFHFFLLSSLPLGPYVFLSGRYVYFSGRGGARKFVGALHPSWRNLFNLNLKSLGYYSEWVFKCVVEIFLRVLTGFF